MKNNYFPVKSHHCSYKNHYERQMTDLHRRRARGRRADREVQAGLEVQAEGAAAGLEVVATRSMVVFSRKIVCFFK